MANARSDKVRQRSDAAVDWRLLPKGSPERKAAVTAERRVRATAARAKKARKRERNAYAAPKEVSGASDSQRRKLLSEAVWWVTVNGVDVETPDELTRMLQKAKKTNVTQFLKQFALAVLPAPPKEAPLPPPEPERTEERIIGPEMKKLRQWLEDHRRGQSYRCPKCGHTEDCSNESAERWTFWIKAEKREHDGGLDHQPGRSNGLAVDA